MLLFPLHEFRKPRWASSLGTPATVWLGCNQSSGYSDIPPSAFPSFPAASPKIADPCFSCPNIPMHPKAQPLPPSATFLFSSSSQMSFVPHKGLESHALDYLVSFSRTAGNKYVSLKFHKKKKNIYALAPSNQIPSEPPSPTSSFHWFSTKQQRTLVIFRVITSKLHLKVKHTLCWLPSVLFPGTKYEPLSSYIHSIHIHSIVVTLWTDSVSSILSEHTVMCIHLHSVVCAGWHGIPCI